MVETYKKIEGFENYSISDFGNVRNDKTGRILKQSHRNGYQMVRLQKDNKTYKNDIHRLVAIAFIDNVDKKKCVDHIDNNIQNNNLINLRWATKSQNSQNRSMSTRNTSGVKGVSWNKNTNKWRADICINGKSIHLGSFLNKDDAINIRVQRAKDEFGEFINKCELVIIV